MTIRALDPAATHARINAPSMSIRLVGDCLVAISRRIFPAGNHRMYLLLRVWNQLKGKCLDAVIG